jgi:two-component system cell cycle response regulator
MMEIAITAREAALSPLDGVAGLFEHLRGIKILIADDEGMVGDVLKSGLALRLGCTPEIANSGDVAMQRLKDEHFTLLITDLKMPGIHGFELVRAARAAHPFICIIVMTGYRNEFPYLEAIRAGANDFIHKPFPLEELEAKIHRVVLESKNLRERERGERKYRGLFQHSSDGMVILDEETLCVADSNHAIRELLKLETSAIAGRALFEFCDDSDRIRLEHWLGMCKRVGRGRMNGIAFHRPDGSSVFVDITVSVIKAEEEDIVLVSVIDVTDKLKVEQQLADAAQKDELTGLYNKRSFNTRLEGAVARGARGEIVALFMIDLDNFKRCNDTHGHQIGDKLLKQVGGAVQASIRAQERDEGYRNGGDEFAVLLYGAPLSACTRIAERIQAEFAKQEAYGTSMSIGICLFRDGMDASTFVKAADEALYKAKRAGKNTIAIAD